MMSTSVQPVQATLINEVPDSRIHQPSTHAAAEADRELGWATNATPADLKSSRTAISTEDGDYE